MGKQLGFYLNSSTCTGCKACQVACKDKNNLPLGVKWRRVTQYGGGGWLPHPAIQGAWVPNNVFVYSLSISCNHCENPACVNVCPTTAMTRRADGVVYVRQDECIGCRFCEWACPYSAPQYNEELGKMSKCNLCMDLIDQGQNPACVDACVMRALEFGDLAQLRGKYGMTADIAPLPSPDLTNPSLVITPHKNAVKSGENVGRILGFKEI